jgi:hypothetical protein
MLLHLVLHLVLDGSAQEEGTRPAAHAAPHHDA